MKKYETPTAEVECLEAKDIITGSPIENDSNWTDFY